MLKLEVSTPSPDPTFPPTLADLSRNASVISTSSSDSGPSPSPILRTPRSRPYRTFTSPRSRSPRSPSTARGSRPPAHLTQEFGLANDPVEAAAHEAAARARSQSRNPNSPPTARDFTFGATLGEGSYSEVKRATYLRTGQQFAIKILEKSFLKRKDKVTTAIDEKNALVRLGAGHPGIVRLHHAFQDQWRLYFVIDLVPNGEMQSLLARIGSLSVKCAQYYTAQIVDALAFMHSKGVVHRDLKPENLLLDQEYRIKLCDFGTAKILEPGVEPDKAFVGTAQYVSPEMIMHNETSISVDYWALGCIVYQMISGRFAFQGLSAYLTMEKIKRIEYTFPEGFDGDAKNLVQRILVRDPTERLGVGYTGTPTDIFALRSHSFLAGTNWDTLWSDPAPPIEPGLVRKEHPLAAGRDQNWEDVGSAWDELASGDDDGLSWASDSPEILLRPNGFLGGPPATVDVGPMGELASYARVSADKAEVQAPSTALHGAVADGVNDTDFPSHRDSPSMTASSSSEGSPTERLGDTLASLKLRSGTAEHDPDQDSERGRSTIPTPLLGNESLNSADILPLLQGDEMILCRTIVESRFLRRRTSKLLPLSSLPKPKSRHLILTTRRLLCVKVKRKANSTTSVKYEFLLKPAEKTKKEKESRGHILSVDRKGEREFVVTTATKSHCFAADDDTTASVWVDKIDQALATYGPSAKTTS
ncbi:hypothetical protein HGRIS_002284 [Hohenbuehelia grisea]|uniref:non-specific serine/threonine protein kinase n=1 Tax=Hohenbuehelia grisea TaxID=104357 RepID=A0ABR3JL78_9AGAR